MLPHRRTLTAGLLAAAALAGAGATDAAALVVSSGADGLQLREPDNILDRVKLSLVDSGGLKYRVELAQFGGRGIGFGPGCTQISTQQGVDVALCERINPVVSQVTLGPMRDTLDVDPAFPDPIHVDDGGIGPDIFTLGAGADVSRADREDTVFGGLGDDQLTSTGGRVDGGEGNDTLHVLGASAGVLVGGPGDDRLTADPESRAIMAGGDGVDSFDARGARAAIDSRDGVPEQVSCGRSGAIARGVATIDLLDLPGDAELIAGGCASVDRAPRGERTAAQLASSALTLKRRTTNVKVRCTTRARCRGTLALSSGGATATKRFAIAGRTTATISLAARGSRATVKLGEAGVAGPRTIRALLALSRG